MGKIMIKNPHILRNQNSGGRQILQKETTGPPPSMTIVTLNSYPAVIMPKQAQGYIKYREFDCL